MIHTLLLIGTTQLASILGGRSAEGDRPTMAPADPGFTEAVFSASVLNDIMSDRDCVRIRFYNVKVGAVGTLMAVGVRADSSDINEGFLWPRPYKANVPGSGDPMHVEALTRSGAESACSAMNVSAPSFSAFVPKGDVQELLRADGRCVGIRVTPVNGSAPTDLQLTAVRMENGSLVNLGTGSQYQRSTAAPCPNACGPELGYSRYINGALLPRQNK